MTLFRLKHVHLENYRCFETLDLSLEDDLTVLFAENGGGKTALLNAIATGLAVFQKGSPSNLKLDASRDPRQATLDASKARREPAGLCTVSWIATSGSRDAVEWSTSVHPASGRTTKHHFPILQAMEQIRMPGERWPLFAWYGVDRLRRSQGKRKVHAPTRDRWEGYASSLDPMLSDAPILEWLQDEVLGDVVRRRQDEPERFYDSRVMEAIARATPGVAKAWYDPAKGSPMVCFDTGHVAPWTELSDGYHVFITLIADIARRAFMLNEIDEAEVLERLEGVVLIDEIDLHLHPKWQRVVLQGLRNVFPKLQLVVSTHSPQVLSSAKNRQVRRLVDGKLLNQGIFVEGRDSNAILRDHMMTDDRDEDGLRELRELHDAIDRGDQSTAEHLFDILKGKWGTSDPALIRAEGLMDWGE